MKLIVVSPVSDTSADLVFWRRFCKTRISIFVIFLLLKLMGATKLSEPSFYNSPCCSSASGLCLVTNRKILIPNKI